MSLAPQVLENSASKFAAEAIRLDSQGSHNEAIEYYQRAIEALVRLVQIYPEYKLNRIYTERANAYQNRIKALLVSQIPITDKSLSRELDSKRAPVTKKDTESTVDRTRGAENHFSDKSDNTRTDAERMDFDDLIMKEKPKVSWGEVIGLEDAKRAIRESIVYPTKRQICFLLVGPRAFYYMDHQGVARRCLQQLPQQKLKVIS